MRPKTILLLGTTFYLSLVALASGQEGGQDKVALQAAEQSRVNLQAQVNVEKDRIINQVVRLPQDQRKKALIDQVKNSPIMQQAHASESGESQTESLRKVNPETAISMSEIIARINSMPVLERKYALREAMKALKGKKLENDLNLEK